MKQVLSLLSSVWNVLSIDSDTSSTSPVPDVLFGMPVMTHSLSAAWPRSLWSWNAGYPINVCSVCIVFVFSAVLSIYLLFLDVDWNHWRK